MCSSDLEPLDEDGAEPPPLPAAGGAAGPLTRAEILALLPEVGGYREHLDLDPYRAELRRLIGTARYETPTAFHIRLLTPPVNTVDRPSLRAGMLLALATRYAGPEHAPDGDPVAHTYRRMLQDAWLAALPHLQAPVEAPYSVVARLKRLVVRHFEERARLAATELGPLGLEELVDHARRQAREVTELFAYHESRLVLRAGAPGGANCVWIDLFAACFNAIADVPLVHWHPALPPPPAAGPPVAAAALPLPAANGPAPFTGQPVSWDIVGQALGLRQAPTMPCRECQSPTTRPGSARCATPA